MTTCLLITPAPLDPRPASMAARLLLMCKGALNPRLEDGVAVLPMMAAMSAWQSRAASRQWHRSRLKTVCDRLRTFTLLVAVWRSSDR